MIAQLVLTKYPQRLRSATIIMSCPGPSNGPVRRAAAAAAAAAPRRSALPRLPLRRCSRTHCRASGQVAVLPVLPATAARRCCRRSLSTSASPAPAGCRAVRRAGSATIRPPPVRPPLLFRHPQLMGHAQATTPGSRSGLKRGCGRSDTPLGCPAGPSPPWRPRSSLPPHKNPHRLRLSFFRTTHRWPAASTDHAGGGVRRANDPHRSTQQNHMAARPSPARTGAAGGAGPAAAGRRSPREHRWA
eukprot:SAG11_NODE_3347_length_2507_cov_1.937733_3_plen_245_part_00